MYKLYYTCRYTSIRKIQYPNNIYNIYYIQTNTNMSNSYSIILFLYILFHNMFLFIYYITFFNPSPPNSLYIHFIRPRQFN